ncbi:unnamed protein product [Schistocephalus solidus]|uniref:Uncharacterized protein n=1 Tax=Schistocephalus solidus TaxID=70667 RepID=A0A183T4H0_SCHSO|nr:unnamed protein product [Schistocephalus solidus]
MESRTVIRPAIKHFLDLRIPNIRIQSNVTEGEANLASAIEYTNLNKCGRRQVEVTQSKVGTTDLVGQSLPWLGKYKEGIGVKSSNKLTDTARSANLHLSFICLQPIGEVQNFDGYPAVATPGLTYVRRRHSNAEIRLASVQAQTASSSSQTPRRSSDRHVQPTSPSRTSTVVNCWHHTIFETKARCCISPFSFISSQSKGVSVTNLPHSSKPDRTSYACGNRSGRRFLVDTGVELCDSSHGSRPSLL